jgi:hypothetical protein
MAARAGEGQRVPADATRVLGVKPSATRTEVRTAYRKLAKALHPDLNPGDRAAEEKFKTFAAAYDLLGDTEKPAGEIGTSNRKVLLTRGVLNAELGKRPDGQRVVWDSKQSGLCVLVSPGPKGGRQATVTFRVAFYLRGQPGKPQYVKLGRYPDEQYTYPYRDVRGEPIVVKCSDIDAMRRAASDIRNRARDQGIDPRRPVASNVFEDVVKDFIELHAKKNRTWKETQRVLDRYVLPKWRHKSIKDIDKSTVSDLLDKIEKKQIRYTPPPRKGQKKKPKSRNIGGPLVASSTLKQISKLFNWHATRSKDDFTSPIVKGMGRGEPKKRSLYLSDAELRAMWPLLDDVYGAVLKTALLTAQRFHKVSHMRRPDLKAHLTVPGHLDADEQWVDDLEIDNVWDAGRDEDPENKQVSAVPLSSAALKAIAAVPNMGGNYVFTLNGREPMKGWSKFKENLDDRMQKALREQGLEFREWQHRDLRRTAKTLMKRAGVSTDISERCLAHVIGGVEGVYDRYDYLREKRDAFDRLATLVERILNPPGDNVVPLGARSVR